MNVKQRGDAIGTFRYIAVRLMETLAYWTPITPEMEAKVLFGRHIYDYAQHADILGKRTFELRQPEHYTRPAAPEYVEVLDVLRRAASTSERFAMLYEVVVPGLIRRYETYIRETDGLLDEPSVVIMERIIADLRRQQLHSQRVRDSIRIADAPAHELSSREAAVVSYVA
jgi:hypothetical protein